MKVEQLQWTKSEGWNASLGNLASAQLVMAYGGSDIVAGGAHFDELRKAYPDAYITGCSTSGEIADVNVCDDSLVVTAVEFESTKVIGKQLSLKEVSDSLSAGKNLGEQLPKEGLVHVFVLSDGLSVNGSELVKGLASVLPADVSVTGGLSGDGARFQETRIIANASPIRDGVTVIGFYGAGLRVGYASLGGWDSFGPERVITRSEGNVLYELDGRSALKLYKQYLAEHAAGLPATGLLFPLSVRIEGDELGTVRTILAVDEEQQSMTFAGDLPMGAYARLMKANFDRLIDGASGAAKTSFTDVGSSAPDLAVLISCVGRKMVLKQRVEEEVEAVREILGEKAVLAGFYSYGEISPFVPNAKCELHNQTMTITTFAEV